jgi:hypothetical protein
MATAPSRTAVLHLQELRDGSWVGNLAWGGRTLTDGGQDPNTLLRRLAAHLLGMPGAGRPDTVKVVRVPRGGQREEQEQDLASLTG